MLLLGNGLRKYNNVFFIQSYIMRITNYFTLNLPQMI